jgi:hypothetical protein
MIITSNNDIFALSDAKFDWERQRQRERGVGVGGRDISKKKMREYD